MSATLLWRLRGSNNEAKVVEQGDNILDEALTQITIMKQIAIAFVIGCAMIVLGLHPGLKDLMESLANEMSHFRNLLSPLPERRPLLLDSNKRLPGQTWLAVVGATLVGLSLFAYFSN